MPNDWTPVAASATVLSLPSGSVSCAQGSASETVSQPQLDLLHRQARSVLGSVADVSIGQPHDQRTRFRRFSVLSMTAAELASLADILNPDLSACPVAALEVCRKGICIINASWRIRLFI
jgi:hypothetical protein